MSTLPWCSASTPRSPSPRRRLLRSQSPIPRRWACLKMFPLWPFLSSGAWENRKTSWSEGAGLHHGGEGEDGEQAVQLADGHVQRGHHRGDHDTGVSRVTPGKNWNSAPIRAVWCGLRKSISDPDSDLSYSHPSLNQSAESKDECDVLQGTALGKEIDPNNPWNMTGKEFDPTKSGVSSRRWWFQRAGCDSLVYSSCSLWWRDDKDDRWCLMSWNCLQVLSAIMEREPEAQPAHHHLPWN